MDELKLIQNIKYLLVTRWISGEVQVWHIDDVLSEIGALILPYATNIKFNNGIDINKYGTLRPIHDALVKFKKKDKKTDLNCFSYTSLVKYLKSNWVKKTTADNKELLIKNITIVKAIEKNGYISLKGNEKVYESIEKMGPVKLNTLYGDVEFTISDSNCSLKSLNQEKIPTDKNTDKELYQTDSDNTLSSINIGKSDKEIDLDNFWVKQKLPLKLQTGTYFWSYKIPTFLYTQIKDKLCALNLSENKRLIKTYAFHIALFLSEWFKREYNGNQGEKGLELIGLDSSSSRVIWENAKLPNEYLLTAGDMREWLFSIYVLGGFPLQYICEGTKFDRLFKDIWTVQQANEMDEETLGEIVASFNNNNAVYKQSLLSGSLYHLIIETVIKGFPIAEADMQEEPYLTFREMLEAGKRICYENFLTHEWTFYTSDESAECEGGFNLKIGKKKDNCYIPTGCVKYWGKDLSSKTEFLLGLQTNDGLKSSHTIRFSKAGKKDDSPFVGWGNSCILSIDISKVELEDIHVMLYDVEDFKRENGISIHHFSSRGFFHLFSTGKPYQWSTRRDNSAQTALLYSPIQYCIDDIHVQKKTVIKEVGDAKWNWLDLHENVSIRNVSSNEVNVISIQKGVLGIILNYDENNIRYNNQKEIIYASENGDNQYIESLPLLLGKKGIKSVIRYPFEEGGSIVKFKPTDSNITIEYKQNTHTYQPLHTANPSTGKMQLRISNGNLIKKMDCFYVAIEKGNPIFQRNLQENQIICNLQDTKVLFPNSIGEYSECALNNKGKYTYDDNSYPIKEDFIPIRIGTETEYAEINIFRARICREIYLQDKLIKTYQNKAEEPVQIPLILAHKFEIRTIDANGVIRYKLGENIRVNHDFDLSSINSNANTIMDTESQIQFYLYADRSKGEKEKVDIGQRGVDQYEFYAWNMESKKEPILITTQYCLEKEELTIPIKLAEKEGNIIFQSLKYGIPRHYLKPIYPDINWMLLTNRIYNMNVLIKCFEVASEHNIYFGQFYPLRRLMYNQEDMVVFFKKYLEYKKNLKTVDFENLHRFAHEFLFEWILLPHSLWRQHLRSDEERQVLNTLFRLSPFVRNDNEKAYMERIIENYWEVNRMPQWNTFRRSQSRENQFVQCIRGIQQDRKLLSNNYHQDNLSFLQELYSQQDICQTVFKFINELV